MTASIGRGRPQAHSRRYRTKTITGGGIRTSWASYKARFEVSIAGDDEQALAAIMTALQPLKGRKGVGAIKPHNRPSILVMRIARDKEPFAGEEGADDQS